MGVSRRYAGWPALAAAGGAAVALWSYVPGGLAPTVMSGLAVLYLAYAWNVVGGILGELSLSTMVFWGMGSYGLVLAGNANRDVRLAVLVAVLLAALLSWLIVAVARLLGLAGLYLAVFTLIIYEIAVAIVVGVPVLGKNEGLILKRTTSADTAAYVLIALVVLAIGVNLAVLTNTMGKRWLSIKDDAVAAEAVGVFSGREKARAYVLSAALTALGGALQAYYLGYAQPGTAMSLELLIAAILAVYVGGPGTVTGPMLGTLLVYGLSAIATSVSTNINVTLYAQLLQYVVAFAIIWALTLGRVSRVGLVFGLSALTRRIVSMRPGAAVRNSPEPLAEPADPTAADAGSTDAAAPARSHGEEVLELRGVSKRFGGVVVLDDVSLSLRAGEIVGLMGPNGAGKTTLCNVITGVVSPDTGSVHLGGDDVTSMSTPERFHQGIARTFQSARLFTSLKIRDNVAITAPRDPDRVRTLLERYGLDGDASAEDAPTFVRRLAEVARALATTKHVLILDEPLAGLTAEQHALILDSLRDVAAAGTAVVLIEHLIQTVAPVCDRLVVMADGAIIADGQPQNVLRDTRVVDAYLGSAHDVEEPSHAVKH